MSTQRGLKQGVSIAVFWFILFFWTGYPKAADVYWIGGEDQLWSNAQNWTYMDGPPYDPPALPGNSDNVYIRFINNNPVIFDVGIGPELYLLLLDGGGAGVTLLQSDPNSAMRVTYATYPEEYIGYYYTGTYDQQAGTNETDRLYLGYHSTAETTGVGYYYLSGGSLSVTNGTNCETIGVDGRGYFYQSGGTHTYVAGLTLGRYAGSQGYYELSGGTLTGGGHTVGYDGTGNFLQSDGENITTDLYLGRGSTGKGTYELRGNGKLTANTEVIGHYGIGEFVQDGEDTVHTVDSLHLGNKSTGQGTYTLKSGLLSTDSDIIGYSGIGTFVQEGGTHQTSSGTGITLGYETDSSGTYKLFGGTLNTKTQVVGRYGAGIFLQTGGTNTAAGSSGVLVGADASGTGDYTLSGGLLQGHVQVGPKSGNNSGQGTLTLAGGRLEASNLTVGSTTSLPGTGTGTGALNITNAAAEIMVSGNLTFGLRSTLTAVPGATINMTGAQFDNKSTTPGNLSGLSNLKLAFTGGLATEDHFEVAGHDYGPVMGGFTNNFALGTLLVGQVGVEDPLEGFVGLYDSFNNASDPPLGDEALYVVALTLGKGSILDLHDLHLYCQSFTDLGGTILQGEIQVVPLPSTLLLLGSGLLGLGLLGYRRRHS